MDYIVHMRTPTTSSYLVCIITFWLTMQVQAGHRQGCDKHGTAAKQEHRSQQDVQATDYQQAMLVKKNCSEEYDKEY